ncbi:hypothetical protein ACEV60_03080 [Enterobacter ludwigii]|uniref:hypothetical protein n=1 Tax=Enterobacter ludwigii TaxID=299767 RepID=UPI001C8B30BE|nr:hypothetical protein [Enterobacter ludwigii]MBX9031219.1 hypothetical protein [Enterobacter ludwigii]
MSWYLFTYKDWTSHNAYTKNKKPFFGNNPEAARQAAIASCSGRFELEDIKLIEVSDEETNV